MVEGMTQNKSGKPQNRCQTLRRREGLHGDLRIDANSSLEQLLLGLDFVISGAFRRACSRFLIPAAESTGQQVH